MGKYAQSKHEFFHNRVDNQKTPDVIIDLKRVSAEQISLWSRDKKDRVIEWLADCEKVFERFKKEIIKATKQS